MTAAERQQHDKRSLPHVGRFTTHIRPCNDKHLVLMTQLGVVCHKLSFKYLLDNRVTPLFYTDT